MDYKIPKFVTKIINTFQTNGYEIYIVGGAVRDLIVGRITDDWDFTTNATPDEMLKILPDNAFCDNSFGTVMFPIDESSTPIDITTFRKEQGYSDSRRPDKVEWGTSLEEDIKRRDFTINALALEVKGDNIKLIDYFEGSRDLGDKLIRAVGDPNERFAEDALRMMRAVRIASELNFNIEEETKIAIRNNKERINNIAAERIQMEFKKLLGSPHAYKGILQMREVGLVEEVLPELEKCFGVEQKSPGRHHIYDVGTHLVESLKYCKSRDWLVRFACLIHDIGKPQTFNKLESGTITFYNHEIAGAVIANRISDRLKLSKKDREKLWILVRYHQFTVDDTQTDKALRRFITKVGIENIPDIMELRTADRLGSGSNETSWRTEEFKSRLLDVQKQPFTVHDLKIDGSDVMKKLGIQPSPKVGQVLDRLFAEVEDGKIKNEREELLKYLDIID